MASQLDERQLFIETLSSVTRGPLIAAIERQLTRESTAGVEQPISEFTFEVLRDLLGELYDLGQRDMKIGLVMIPLMAQLKKAARVS